MKREREGKKHPCAKDTLISCLSHAPNWGPGPQPRHVPWLGIEPATFWFAGQHSIHWATPTTASFWNMNQISMSFSCLKDSKCFPFHSEENLSSPPDQHDPVWFGLRCDLSSRATQGLLDVLWSHQACSGLRSLHLPSVSKCLCGWILSVFLDLAWSCLLTKTFPGHPQS